MNKDPQKLYRKEKKAHQKAKLQNDLLVKRLTESTNLIIMMRSLFDKYVPKSKQLKFAKELKDSMKS